MDAEKLFKKGNPAKAEDGTLLLVNDEKSAYSVNEAVVMIWNMCNGIAFNDLVKNIATDVSEDATKLRPSLEGLINELQEAKLLEIKT